MTSPKSKTHSYLKSAARFNRRAAPIDQRLLIRSTPKADESLLGFLVRLTEENGYDSPSWILRLAGIDYGQHRSSAFVYTAASLDKLAALTGNQPSELAAFTYPTVGVSEYEDIVLFYSSSLYKYLLHPERPKICPDCLGESGYCRRIWDLA